jgi:hypothetical protein
MLSLLPIILASSRLLSAVCGMVLAGRFHLDQKVGYGLLPSDGGAQMLDLWLSASDLSQLGLQ